MPTPLIGAGITAAAGYLSSRNSNKAQEQLTGQQQGLVNEQTSLSRLLRGQGEKTFNMSAPAYGAGLNFYKTLVYGGPGALRQQMSGENSLTNQVYQGAKMGLDRSGMRGGVGDQAKAALDRQRAGQIAGVIPGIRENAASKLLSGGISGMNTSTGMGGAGVTGYGNAGMTYANMANNLEAQQRRKDQQWGDLGASLSEILGPWLMNYKGGGGGKKPNAGRGGYVPRVLPPGSTSTRPQ